MWEETSLKLEQICDGCHRVHFPHWIIQLLRSISNDLSTGCSKWLSSAVPPLNQSPWGAHFDIFLCCNGVNHHWVIMPSSYLSPLLFSPYLNVYSFPLEAETQSSADQPIAQLAMFVWGWGLLILAPARVPFIISENSGACLTAAHYWPPLKQEVESMTRAVWPHRSLISNRPV